MPQLNAYLQTFYKKTSCSTIEYVIGASLSEKIALPESKTAENSESSRFHVVEINNVTASGLGILLMIMAVIVRAYFCWRRCFLRGILPKPRTGATMAKYVVNNLQSALVAEHTLTKTLQDGT